MSERTKTATGRLMWWEQLGTRSWGLGVAADILSLEERLTTLEERTAVGVAGMDPATDRKSAATHGACASPCSQPFDSAPITLDAAPAARASVGRPRTDKADLPTRAGTGDTPATHATHGEGSVRRERTEPVAWGVANGNGLLATSISRIDAVDMQSYYACDTAVVPLYRHPPVTKPMPQEKQAEVSDRSKPITGPDPDSRVWETHTPATHATPAQGSVQRECTEPVAWAVACDYGDYAVALFSDEASAQTEADRRALVGLRPGCVVVPLYRHPQPTLTDAEAETLRELRDEAAQYADEIGLCASEVRGRQRIIDGLLVRLGGER